MPDCQRCGAPAAWIVSRGRRFRLSRESVHRIACAVAARRHEPVPSREETARLHASGAWSDLLPTGDLFACPQHVGEAIGHAASVGGITDGDLSAVHGPG